MKTPGHPLAVMLVTNFWPLAHVCATVFLVVDGRPVWALLTLYLAPPLLARLLRVADGQHPIASGSFVRWWITGQLQMLFNRLPFLDEALRLVPGLYSLWIRLWGSRVGRLTFWAPGVVVIDRGYLDVGDNVIFGVGVRLAPHVMVRVEDKTALSVGVIHIGAQATVGAYSLLTAGTRISAGDFTRARLLSPPFTTWEKGRRVSP